MQTKTTRIVAGDEDTLALPLDATLCAALALEEGDPVVIEQSVDKTSLIVRRERPDERRARLAATADAILTHHADTFRRLAL